MNAPNANKVHPQITTFGAQNTLKHESFLNSQICNTIGLNIELKT